MAKYKTIGMARNGGLQKDINDYMFGGGTPYLNSQQRQRYLVTLNPWNHLDRDGKLMDSGDAIHSSYIFVMDGDGNIYSEDKMKVHHHSAFLSGGPVAAAGHWTVWRGIVIDINNESGHYMPPWDYTEQVITELISRGYDASGLVRNYSGGTSSQLTKARKARNIPVERMGSHGVERKYL